MKELTEPIERRRGGGLEIWLPPLGGKEYIVAVDTAGGGANGDFAAIQVVELETGAQCAELRERLGTLEVARAAATLAREYAGALVAVERNNHGAGVLAYLDSTERYGRLYERDGVAGWLTTGGKQGGDDQPHGRAVGGDAVDVSEPAAAGGVQDVCESCRRPAGGGVWSARRLPDGDGGGAGCAVGDGWAEDPMRCSGCSMLLVRGVRLAVLAVQAIRRMRGGAQSQLMLGADGKLWVVKFQNNPQHLRVLANELIATRLAAAIGLTVPQTDVVEVTEWLIANTAEMYVELGRGRREACSPGLQFGSQFAGGLMPGQVVDYLPEQQMQEVRNIGEFAGMLVIDKWTGNCNGRQAVFERRSRERRYRAIFIDQGFCFNAGEWTFPDSPLRGVYPRNLVYAGVTGWTSFEPWISRIESMDATVLWSIAEAVPPEWVRRGDLRA